MAFDRLEKSCGCIIVKLHHHTQEVLLIRHVKGGHWSFPKGHMEENEDELTTAHREVLEETGLDVRIQREFRTTSHYLTKKQVPKEVVYYLASTPDEALRLQKEEVSDAEWLPIPAALQRLTYDRDRKVLEEALPYIANVDL